jgi:hypothetical protein
MVFDGQSRSDILTYTATQDIKKSLSYHFKLTAINFVGTSKYSAVLTCFAAVVPLPP